MESVENAGLRLRIEIHERISADQQIDFGDRGIVNQIVAPEDHAASERLLEIESAVLALKVPLAHFLRDVLHFLRRVRSVSRIRQRVVVQIRRVYLHALEKWISAKPLGENHRQSVSLLTGGAPGAPYPYWVAAPLVFDDLGNDVIPQILPRHFVAEEGSHIDQDSIEQTVEFRGLTVEDAHVIAERVGAYRLHAFPDTAKQARALVTGEIEAARLLQQVQQAVEFPCNLAATPCAG